MKRAHVALPTLLLSIPLSCTPQRTTTPTSPTPVASVTVAATPPVEATDPMVEEPDSPPTSEADLPASDSQELQVTELAIGSGKLAGPNAKVELHYVGTLDDGTVFDSTRQRGRPFVIELGRGRLIEGFEKGVVGMREGGVRRVRIPFHLAYGEKGRPPTIPPRAALTFELELLRVY